MSLQPTMCVTKAHTNTLNTHTSTTLVLKCLGVCRYVCMPEADVLRSCHHSFKFLGGEGGAGSGVGAKQQLTTGPCCIKHPGHALLGIHHYSHTKLACPPKEYQLGRVSAATETGLTAHRCLDQSPIEPPPSSVPLSRCLLFPPQP